MRLSLLDTKVLMDLNLSILYYFDFHLATLLVPTGRLPMGKQNFCDSHTSPKFYEKLAREKGSSADKYIKEDYINDGKIHFNTTTLKLVLILISLVLIMLLKSQIQSLKDESCNQTE